MEGLFVLLFLISLVALLIGLINPKIVVKWGNKRTRAKVFLYYGLSMVIFFILFGITHEALEKGKNGESEEKRISRETQKMSVEKKQGESSEKQAKIQPPNLKVNYPTNIILDRAYEMIHNISKVQQGDLLYNNQRSAFLEIAKAYGEIGNKEKEMQSLSKAFSATEKLSERKALPFSYIVDAYVDRKEWEKAIAVADRIGKEDIIMKYIAYYTIAIKMAEFNLDKALQLIDKIDQDKEPFTKARAYLFVSGKGSDNLIINYLNESLRLAQNCQKEAFKKDTKDNYVFRLAKMLVVITLFCEVGVKLITIKEVERGEEVISYASNLIDEMTAISYEALRDSVLPGKDIATMLVSRDKDIALSIISKKWAEVAYIDKAAQFSDMINSEESRQETKAEIFFIQAENKLKLGKRMEAAQTLDSGYDFLMVSTKMRDPSKSNTSIKLWTRLAVLYVKSQEFSKAYNIVQYIYNKDRSALKATLLNDDVLQVGCALAKEGRKKEVEEMIKMYKPYEYYYTTKLQSCLAENYASDGNKEEAYDLLMDALKSLEDRKGWKEKSLMNIGISLQKCGIEVDKQVERQVKSSLKKIESK